MLGRRAYTTIDRSKPNAAVALAAGAALRQGHEGRRSRSTSPTTSPARSPRTSSASSSAAAEQHVRHERRLHLRLQRGVLGSWRRRQVDDVHLHRRLRLGHQPAPDGTGVGVRDRRRRVDPRQPERPEPEPRRPRRRTCPTPACDGVVLDRTAPSGRRSASRDVGQGRRPRVLRRPGVGRDLGRGRRRDWTLGRQHRRRDRRRRHATPTRSPAPTRWR